MPGQQTIYHRRRERALDIEEDLNIKHLAQTEDLVSKMDVLSGWVKDSGAGVVSIDAADYLIGAGSLKIVCAAADTIVVSHTPATALDVRHKSIILAVKIDAYADISSLALRLHNGASYQEFADIKPWITSYGGASWQYVSLHPCHLTGAVIQLNNITKISLVAVTAAAKTPTLRFNHLLLVRNLPPRIILGTDDGNASDYTEFFPRLVARGWRGVIAPITRNIGYAGKITRAQAQIMDRAGMQFAGHTTSHADLTAVDAGVALREVLGSKTDLHDMGLLSPAEDFPLPFGRFSPDNINMLRRHFKLMWGVQPYINAPSDLPLTAYRMQADVANPSASLSPLLSALATHGGVLSLFWHEIGGAGYSTTLFEQCLDLIEASGIEVILPRTLRGYTSRPQTERNIVTIEDLLLNNSIVPVPVNAGWTSSHAGSGTHGHDVTYMTVATGATAGSRGLVQCIPYVGEDMGLSLNRKTVIKFRVTRGVSDANAVARVQFKPVATEGDLAGKGFAIKINDLTLLGESYGTARGEVALGSLSAGVGKMIMIVLYPGEARRIEWWVNGVLLGTQTDLTMVPFESLAWKWLVVSILNGASAVNVNVTVGNILIGQEP